MLANQSRWNCAALRDTFLHGLVGNVKNVLVSYKLPASLVGAIVLAIQVDQHLQTRCPMLDHGGVISNFLAAGIIQPFWQGRDWVFMLKKDKTLRRCINYRSLNDTNITFIWML